MHDSVAVSLCQGVHDIAEDSHDLTDRQLMLFRQAGAERLARDERHRIVQQSAFGTGGENGDYVWMLEARRQQDLALEALSAQASGELRRKYLDDDLPIERQVVDEKDARHSAAAQLALDAVPLAKDVLQPFLEDGNRALP
jgi:hypothetical protein